MVRPPGTVIAAAMLTGLQGIVIALAALVIGFIFLLMSGWEGEHKNLDLLFLVFGAIGLLGVLAVVGAIMVWSGSRRWAMVIAVFDVALLVLQTWVVAVDQDDNSQLTPASISMITGLLMWNLVPLICLGLSWRWFGSRQFRPPPSARSA